MTPQAATPNVGFDTRVSKLKGSEYMNDNWLLGGLLFQGEDKYIENLTVRYNILNEVLEIQNKNYVKVASTTNIDAFYIVGVGNQRHFKAATNYKNDKGEALTGFLEVLEDGKYQYLRHNRAYIKKPNYKEEFHVGSMDYEIVPTTDEYIAENNVLYPVNAFIKEKRKNNPALKKFIRVNSLFVKEPDHVAKMVEFLNQNEE
ncbi:hypothetical protein D770_20985 [Flammeovirgaceae bacterium 311]|nr:hypothetical protein D770_20985 [Flammeovirgaceae bacterium 311]